MQHDRGQLILPSPFRLSGRVALVTGAGAPDGIGMATARLLGALGAGVAVAATTDRAVERAGELAAAGFASVGVVADLTEEDQVLDALTAVERALGRPTILVNNAGMTSISTPTAESAPSGGAESGTAAELDHDAWRRSLARNLDTSFLMTRAVLPGMQDQGWGRVVMVASTTGPVMAMRGEAAYAAAKAGMVGLARSVAVDYARHGVTANAVAPGWIRTGSQKVDEEIQRQARRSGEVPPRTRSPRLLPSCAAQAPPTSPASVWWSMAETASPSSAAELPKLVTNDVLPEPRPALLSARSSRAWRPCSRS